MRKWITGNEDSLRAPKSVTVCDTDKVPHQIATSAPEMRGVETKQDEKWMKIWMRQDIVRATEGLPYIMSQKGCPCAAFLLR